MSIEDRLARLSPAKLALLNEKLRQLQGNSPRKQTELVAFIGATQVVEERAVSDMLEKRLPQYMVPSRIVRLDHLPLTPNGKVDRRALEKIAQRAAPGSAVADVQSAAVADEIETQLFTIWRELLGHDSFTKYDNFFQIGGHSLQAIRMLARLNAALQTNLPVALIVESPTISRLSQAIRSRRDQSTLEEDTLVALQPDGSLPPLYLLPLHMHGALHYRHLTAQLGVRRPIFAFEAFDIREENDSPVSVEALAQEYCRQLLNHQPQGPYYLCGISVAGLLAFEMARELHKRGIRDVEVILLDTYGPRHPQKIVGTSKRTGILSAALWRMFSASTVFDWGLATLLKARTPLKKHSHAKQETSVQTLLTPDGANLEEAFAYLEDDFVNKRLGRISHDYLEGDHPFEGDLHLLRARLEALDNQYDLTLGWQAVVRGAIQVRHVRGDHLGILRRLYAQATAKQVQEILGECDVRHGIKHAS